MSDCEEDVSENWECEGASKYVRETSVYVTLEVYVTLGFGTSCD